MAALPPQPPPNPPADSPLPSPPAPAVYAPLPSPPPPSAYAGAPPFHTNAALYGTLTQHLAPPVPRQRTGMILAAQILMIVKGSFWLISGLAIGGAGLYISVNGRGVVMPGSMGAGLADVALGAIFGLAVVLLAAGVADIVLGVTLGRPSNMARRFTVALISVAGCLAILGLVREVSRGTSPGAMVVDVLWLVVNSFIFYVLVIDERSREAFN